MNPWITVAGWTLVHFLWEGMLIGLAAVLLLELLHRRSPEARYAVACGALLLMLAAPLVTVRALSQSDWTDQRDVMARMIERNSRLRVGADAVSRVRTPVMPTNPAAIDAPVAADASSASPIDVGARSWLPLVVAIWMTGVAILLARLAGGWWRIRRLHRAALVAPPSRWTAASERIASALSLRRVVHVVDSMHIDTPTVVGWMKPVIVLPIAALACLSPTQVDAILAHELAHIRRHDFIVNLLQTFAETFLFYHPAVWWISARIRIEREHCCDQVAISVCLDAVSYAEALVELETWRTHDATLALEATGGTLMARVRRVLGTPSDDLPRSFGALTMIVVLSTLVSIVAATHYVRAAQPAIDQEPPSAIDHSDAEAWQMVFTQSDSQMRFIGFRGRDLIRFAYQIPSARVMGGPRWLDEQILRLVVTLDAAPGADEMPRLVRQVLEERLQLKTHVEQRNFPVLALAMARPDGSLGPNLRISATDCFDQQAWIDAGQPPRVWPPAAPRQPVCGEELWNRPIGHTSYVAITMPQFAEELRDVARGWSTSTGHVTDVVDRTGLTGRYDVHLRGLRLPLWVTRQREPLVSLLEPLGLSSWPRMLEEQLGLTLEESEAPYDVIVIDSAERPAQQ
jgi:uncharacterized protein (TIGR03435 family)